jgi:hypothetical protein
MTRSRARVFIRTMTLARKRGKAAAKVGARKEPAGASQAAPPQDTSPGSAPRSKHKIWIAASVAAGIVTRATAEECRMAYLGRSKCVRRSQSREWLLPATPLTIDRHGAPFNGIRIENYRAWLVVYCRNRANGNVQTHSRAVVWCRPGIELRESMHDFTWPNLMSQVLGDA